MTRRAPALLVLSFSTLAAGAPCVQTGPGTPLANAAANLAAGQFCELSTTNFNPGGQNVLSTPSNGGTVLEYADSAVWDPGRRQFSFLGVSHHGTFVAKFVRYLDSGNRWEEGPLPASSTSALAHGYDHNAINPATGDVFFRETNSRKVHRYSSATGQWGLIATVPTTVLEGIQIAGGLEYFPDRGALVLVDAWGIASWNEATNTWSLIQPLPGIGQYHSFVEYNPVHRVLWFGGGNQAPREIRRMDAAATITTLADAPIDMGILSTIVTVDPVSGRYLVFSSTTSSQFWQYDIVTDRWTVIPVAHPLWRTSDGQIETIETPVSTYGVILFVKWSPAAVYIYKHTVASGPPNAPSALRVQ